MVAVTSYTRTFQKREICYTLHSIRHITKCSLWIRKCIIINMYLKCICKVMISAERSMHNKKFIILNCFGVLSFKRRIFYIFCMLVGLLGSTKKLLSVSIVFLFLKMGSHNDFAARKWGLHVLYVPSWVYFGVFWFPVTHIVNDWMNLA